MSSSSIPSAIRTRLPVEVGPAPVDGVEAADTPPVGVGVEVTPSTPPVGLGLGLKLMPDTPPAGLGPGLATDSATV